MELIIASIFIWDFEFREKKNKNIITDIASYFNIVPNCTYSYMYLVGIYQTILPQKASNNTFINKFNSIDR